RVRSIPGEHHPDSFRTAGWQRHRYIKGGAGRSFFYGRCGFRSAFLHGVPCHGEWVPPSAAEPAVIDDGVGVVGENGEAGVICLQDKTIGKGGNAVCLVVFDQEILCIEGEDRVCMGRSPVYEVVFDSAYREAGIVFVGRYKRAPAGDGDPDRDVLICQMDGGEGKGGGEGGFGESGQTIGGTRVAVACTARS